MPNKWIAGGRGDMSGASNDNGGGFVQGGTATYLTCQDSNGGPASYHATWNNLQSACNVVNDNGNVKINAPDIYFGACYEGTYAYVEFADTYLDDWYNVIEVHIGGGHIVIDLVYTSDTTCDCHVGGAFGLTDGVKTAFELLANTSDEVLVATDVSSSTVHSAFTTITLNAIVGGATAPIIIKGVNKEDGTDLSLTDARPTIRATAILASGIIYINNSSTDYYKWENIIIDGDGLAAYCVYCSTTANWHYWTHCEFKNGTFHNVNSAGDYWTFIDCESSGSGIGIGIKVSGDYCLVINSPVHDNGAHGMNLLGVRSIGVGCTSYDNTERGLALGNGNYGGAYIDCTEYDAGHHGYHIGTGTFFVIVCNCTASGNNVATYKDYNFDGTTNTIGFFGYNHANSTTYCSECSNGNFADFQKSNNVSGDPKFVSVVDESEDFDLSYTSPLLRAGVNGSTIGAGSHDGGWPRQCPPGSLVGSPITGAF